ncbi:hypothetical protein K469DRAFT_634349 [Zopfia rhizophila CBS 207.26]|uniref:Uncharacterized protein n=1 Tax=Zopfia rhizophila CBS 207.26 TaxID=1314779 RepID=A0A6A6E0H7_9PEZI|nr:hypothetical protein K469DRAFT_634349 [Zopfia rhizophila CBS 207.26]
MAVLQQIQELASRSENYVLLQRFAMPTEHGPKDAIAVTVPVSKILLSFYTLMMNVIILHLWYLFVLVAIAVAAKSRTLTRNMGVANVAIWNSQASPLSIIKSMFEYRSHIPGYAFMWAAAAFLAWACAFIMSLLVSPSLIIGTAAPANLQNLYYPTHPGSQESSAYLRYNSLLVPSNLRAIEVLEAANPKTGQKTNTSSFNVVVQDPKCSKDSSGNQTCQIDYSFHLSGIDFGLQYIPDLRLEVQGSCRTEYSWYQGYDVVDNITVDFYNVFNDPEVQHQVSLGDGKAPIATVFLPSSTIRGANLSFAFIISSMQRLSYTPGVDPWYLTEPYNGDDFAVGYQVQQGRPGLLCWEQSLWSHGDGPKKSIVEIEQVEGLQPGLVEVFKAALSQPRIIGLAQALGTSALKSAATSVGLFFDAETSNLHQDLQRLVLGAYVATKNTLAETTMFNDPPKDIPNLAFDQKTKQFKDGVADFVIYGSNFAALSVRVIIVVPVITVFLWLSVYLLTDNPCIPLPWAYVNALKAPVLYSSVDNETLETERPGNWKRTSQAPYYTEKESLVAVRPKYDLESRVFSWDSHTQGMRNDSEGSGPKSPRTIEEGLKTNGDHEV